MKMPPREYDGPFGEFFSQFIEPNLPTPETVSVLHEELKNYVAERDAIFFVRQMKDAEPWRRRTNRFAPRTALGGRVAFTDNSPQWALHALAFRSQVPRGAAFSAWLRVRMPCHVFEVGDAKLGETLNDARWHAAHIFAVKDGDVDWQSWTREELVRRFVRNVHPCNLLLLPIQDWQRLGRQKDLLAFAVERYRHRYARVFGEALDWMGEPSATDGETALPRIQYSSAASSRKVDANELVLRESSERRIHLEGFGVRFAGEDGQRTFMVTVELVDGTRFGPLKDVSALELLTRLDLQGDHFRKNEFFSSDYFFIEGGRLHGKTECAERLARRLSRLRH